MDDDGAAEEQRASARLGVEALRKPGFATGLHLLRFQIGETAHGGGGCASGTSHLKLDPFIAQRNSIVNTPIL